MLSLWLAAVGVQCLVAWQEDSLLPLLGVECLSCILYGNCHAQTKLCPIFRLSTVHSQPQTDKEREAARILDEVRRQVVLEGLGLAELAQELFPPWRDEPTLEEAERLLAGRSCRQVLALLHGGTDGAMHFVRMAQLERYISLLRRQQEQQQQQQRVAALLEPVSWSMVGMARVRAANACLPAAPACRGRTGLPTALPACRGTLALPPTTLQSVWLICPAG